MKAASNVLTYQEVFLSLRISLVAQVARVLAFCTLERRPWVSRLWIVSFSSMGMMVVEKAVHKSLHNTQGKGNPCI